MKEKIISTLIAIVYGLLVYYFFLPALNIQSIGFWFYITSILTVWIMCNVIANFILKKKTKHTENLLIIYFSIIAVVFFGIIIINIVMSPLFQSKAYANRIEIDETGTFTEDVEKVDFSSLPLLDKNSSRKVGDRVMGQMSELVSQFYVSNLYTQINFNDEIVRVTPLEYNGFFKYLSNNKNGITGYIKVNSVTGVAELVKLEKGMKYVPSAIFNEDLSRKLRFLYPTKIFGPKSFEIDNEGNPYWIVPSLKYNGVQIREEVEGLIVLDAITGKSKYYNVKDVPTWVDHVYSADLIIEQTDDWGSYKNGFFNSIFGQKNVTMTTDGYNYIAMKDDIYLYTGITSVASDESNLGFILTNMRTKETKFYAVPGAEEYSAMDSAEGQVQQMKYKATFPLLINLNNKPTYVISLKDNAELVKMYAFVDVQDYQKVVVTDASKGIEEAARNYLGNEKIDYSDSKLKEKEITISSIQNTVINGNTTYFIKDTENKKYKVSIDVAESVLPFTNNGDKLTISYIEETELTKIEKIK